MEEETEIDYSGWHIVIRGSLGNFHAVALRVLGTLPVRNTRVEVDGTTLNETRRLVVNEIDKQYI